MQAKAREQAAEILADVKANGEKGLIANAVKTENNEQAGWADVQTGSVLRVDGQCGEGARAVYNDAASCCGQKPEAVSSLE